MRRIVIVIVIVIPIFIIIIVIINGAFHHPYTSILVFGRGRRGRHRGPRPREKIGAACSSLEKKSSFFAFWIFSRFLAFFKLFRAFSDVFGRFWRFLGISGAFGTLLDVREYG